MARVLLENSYIDNDALQIANMHFKKKKIKLKSSKMIVKYTLVVENTLKNVETPFFLRLHSIFVYFTLIFELM